MSKIRQKSKIKKYLIWWIAIILIKLWFRLNWSQENLKSCENFEEEKEIKHSLHPFAHKEKTKNFINISKIGDSLSESDFKLVSSLENRNEMQYNSKIIN